MLQANVVERSNLYDLLQVAPGAGQTEIRSAYRRLSRQYHPDSHTPAANERLQQQINAAWDVLSSPLTRAQYDRQLALDQPRPIRSAGVRGDRRSPAESVRKPTDAPPEQAASKMTREQEGNASRPTEGLWQRVDSERVEWEVERRRAESERIREELERQRLQDEQARLVNDPGRAQYQRIMREREIRIAAERASQQPAAPVRSAATVQEAAEQARDRLRVRRQQLFDSRG